MHRPHFCLQPQILLRFWSQQAHALLRTVRTKYFCVKLIEQSFFFSVSVAAGKNVDGASTRLTRRMQLSEHMSSPPVFSVVPVIRSLVLCVSFIECCLFFCPFSFGHCVVCSSSIYGFWLPLWYLQTLFAILGSNAFRTNTTLVCPTLFSWQIAPCLERHPCVGDNNLNVLSPDGI
jgi:hypothetical protein